MLVRILEANLHISPPQPHKAESLSQEVGDTAREAAQDGDARSGIAGLDMGASRAWASAKAGASETDPTSPAYGLGVSRKDLVTAAHRDE
eukprot:scaffold878_cov271-Pinguiococcus_pyrenoidosus.AAC.52